MKAFNNACDALKLGVKERSQLLGVNRVTLNRNVHCGFSPKSKTWELQLHFIRLYRSLYAISGGNSEFMYHWFNTNNRALNGVPASICLKIDGLFRTNQYLDAMRGKV
ncbi:MbcA/ParS/Xre antitoxin family protein [Psychromonas antarctica]|uniref:MbcA/ParS/Xre antitoxin family protein n=1 Tax=Psychromonas antarctica TaxID=67573 RepID=UPI001EE94314|nr:MbcA/ParS/Xre antitoxin family protein [Psychromonas antarctica]MCG6200782.1 MbcA/ParS/Xre antitoxin family protein [Psychromonas antarctica]